MTSWKSTAAAFFLSLATAGTAPHGVLHADSVAWNNNLMDARIQNRPLPEALQILANATGWRVYLEPDTRPPVTAHFERLAVTQALPRLLHDLNFALLPSADGPARLYVFRTTSTGATELIRPNRLPLPPLPSADLSHELIVTLPNPIRDETY